MKEDLRVIKTRKKIEDTFLEMRLHQSLREIRVNELCRRAQINKTTFYYHYQDIYQLSEQLEQKLFDGYFRDFDSWDELLHDPAKYMRDIQLCGRDYVEPLYALFHGNEEAMAVHTAKYILNHYITPETDKKKANLISFILCGYMFSFDMLQGYYKEKYTLEENVEDSVQLIEKLLK